MMVQFKFEAQHSTLRQTTINLDSGNYRYLKKCEIKFLYMLPRFTSHTRTGTHTWACWAHALKQFSNGKNSEWYPSVSHQSNRSTHVKCLWHLPFSRYPSSCHLQAKTNLQLRRCTDEHRKAFTDTLWIMDVASWSRAWKALSLQLPFWRV